MNLYVQIVSRKKNKMDEILFHSKFDKNKLPGNFYKTWENIQTQLLDFLLNKRGLHHDELEAYNSYLPEIVKLIEEHGKIDYVDKKDRLHKIRISDVRFLLPFEQKHGFDNPLRALLRDYYESDVYVSINYTVLVKKNIETTTTTTIESHVVPYDQSLYTEQVHFVRDNYHHFMTFPVWLQSRLCIMKSPFCPSSCAIKPYLKMGCSFVVSRNSFKVVPYEEGFINNRILASENYLEIRSKFHHLEKRFRTNSTMKIMIETKKIRKFNWTKIFRIMVIIPYEKPEKKIPITVLVMAYGWKIPDFLNAVMMFLKHSGIENKQEIETAHMFLESIRTDTDECRNQQEATKRIAHCFSKCKKMTNEKDISDYIKYTLKEEFLPNLMLSTMNEETEILRNRENIRKGLMLAESVAELILHSPIINDFRPPEEKRMDFEKRSYYYKRIDSPGHKMAVMIRKQLKKVMKNGTQKLRTALEYEKNIEFDKILNKKLFTLSNAIKNGVWGEKEMDLNDNSRDKTHHMQKGFCTDESHTQVNKIVKTANKKNMTAGPLLTHPTQTGRVDLYRTPESDKCGVVRPKALGARITGYPDYYITQKTIDKLLKLHPDFRPIDESFDFSTEWTIVKDVFGGVIGWVKDVMKLYKIFTKYRRKTILDPSLEFEWDANNNIFYFICDEGRLLRPLIILENFQKMIHDLIYMDVEMKYHPDPVELLLSRGYIEYLGANEEYSFPVVVAESYEDACQCNFTQTHLEIHSCLSFSLTVCKAFANFNQGPRRMYTGNMENKSMSVKLEQDRGTTQSVSLVYGELPLISEDVDKVLKLREQEPNGFNCFVGILATEYNIEDAQDYSRTFIENGALRAMETRTYVVPLNANCVFECPDEETKGKAHSGAYANINPDGTAKIGSWLKGGDIVTGQIFTQKGEKWCLSRTIPSEEQGRVIEVHNFQNRVIRTCIYNPIIPDIGNKTFFRHGQKGTISILRNREDSPFVESGPMAGVEFNVLINVAALARNTTGFLYELFMSFARSIKPSMIEKYKNLFMSKKTFQEKFDTCCKILQQFGFQRNGKFPVRDGTTGRRMKCDIFGGFAYIGALNHIAQNKLRVRDRGPLCELTRQATVGKKAHGGMRSSEGDVGNVASYGASDTIRDINYESADSFVTYYCNRCRSFYSTIGNKDMNMYLCVSCRKSDKIVRLKVPYITSLLLQEIYCLGFGHTPILEN